MTAGGHREATRRHEIEGAGGKRKAALGVNPIANPRPRVIPQAL
jgi:hypothetical protein